ncbi:MAG: hypothetical protein ABIO70_14365 [Pseudomonadota bacterium]
MIRLLPVMLLSLGLCGCGEKAECDQDTPCSFGATCVEGQCVSARCATGAQCGMGQRCDAGRCVEGCSGDEDCYPGDACDLTTNTCVDDACEDAHRDCAFKEFCNAASGECYEAAGYWCRGCNGDDDCGESGEVHCYAGYCMPECTKDSDCPAGFYCYGLVDNEGNPQYYVCFSDCELYQQYKGGGAPAAPPPASEARTLPLSPAQRYPAAPAVRP